MEKREAGIGCLVFACGHTCVGVHYSAYIPVYDDDSDDDDDDDNDNGDDVTWRNPGTWFIALLSTATTAPTPL